MFARGSTGNRLREGDDDSGVEIAAIFLVLNGELLIDVEGSATITLARHQACTVPKGVIHRTRATRRTTILMVEAAGVMPVGD